MVDADAGKDIQPLVDGDVLNLATLPTRNLSVRANTAPGTVGSVRFVLNGQPVQTENILPYSLAGNTASNGYLPWTPAAGEHNLVAIPYSEPRGQGAAGQALTVRFQVIDEAAPDGQLRYAYYEGDFRQLPNFARLTPVAEGQSDGFALDVRQRNDDFALRFVGCVNVPVDGAYRFYTTSDDGTQLFVDGQMVVNNDGLHSARARSGQVQLSAGSHAIELTFFEHLGREVLAVQWSGPGVDKEPLPASALSTEGCVASLTLDVGAGQRLGLPG